MRVDLVVLKPLNFDLRKYLTGSCISPAFDTNVLTHFMVFGQVIFISLDLCFLTCNMRKLFKSYDKCCTFILTMNFIFILCN